MATSHSQAHLQFAQTAPNGYSGHVVPLQKTLKDEDVFKTLSEKVPLAPPKLSNIMSLIELPHKASLLPAHRQPQPKPSYKGIMLNSR